METRSKTLKKRLDMGGGDELDSPQEMSDNIPLSPQTNDVTIGKWKFNKVILSTHFNIFLYATCFWIQIGTLPYLTKKLGVDPVFFGYLQTTFAVVQLCGGPVYGRFGDMFGGRAAMVLAFASASATYFLMGIADSFFLLFISRLPSIFMHAMQGGQMIVTDLGEEGKRADALGKLGLSYGVGMVIGPFLGGLVTKYSSEQAAAFVACFGSFLSIAFVWMFVPQRTKKTQVKEASSSAVFSVKKILALVQAPGAGFLLFIRMLAGLPIGVFQSMFSVVALETFKLPAEQNGYLLSYVGILTMIVQGLGVGIVTKKYSENDILKWSSFLLVWSYLALAFVTDVFQLCVVMAPLVVGLASSNIVVSSALTKTVADQDTGAMLGLNMAVNSLIRSVSPTVGGFLLKSYGFQSFGYLGFVMLTISTIILFIKLRQ
ncbi:solute carrier family 22 member 18-like [Crassostrea virginica]|uniref:Organic cation transporter-like protein 2 n=1 Tax=Crassostrea virginica TaxID=6565 RepID=A0A8B8EE48_CRAVI|nr:solute carrier family 22 member 18-like [Crassostrea virginica]XP_022337793.1 solute carrier family 22 member 18-like [Crassostrea virginica]XP_022337801.1 solute carrier family 22 member 18-like [Crassostrea virginica]